MRGLEHIVLEHPIFAGLEARIGTTIAGCARNLRFTDGALVFREGAPADEFYLIREGCIALEIGTPGRPAAVVATIGPGEIAGVSWLVAPYRWSYDGRAIAATRAIGIDARCLREKCEADHDLGYIVLQRMITTLIRRLHHTRIQHLDVYRNPGS